MDLEELGLDSDDTDEDVVPEPTDLRVYGLSIGIDLGASPGMRWVVQEALLASLPRRWAEHVDFEGRTYFFNEVSEESVWLHPMDVIYRTIATVILHASAQIPADNPDARKLRRAVIHEHLQGVHRRATASLEDWSGPYTSEHGEYYYNAVLGQSSWYSPLDDWERELALCERVLSTCLLPPELRGPEPRIRLRTVALSIICLRRLFVRPTVHKRSYELDAVVDPAVIRQIDCDIPRTDGGDAELGASLGVARSLLLRYAAEDPELGYCQGMNMVAAVFAVATSSQEEAYRRFFGFTQSIRGLWLPGFPLLMQGMAHFEVLAEPRPWFQHLCRHHVQPDMYLPRAWMGLFSKWLPLPTRVLFLRKLEGMGLAGLLALTLSILDLHLPYMLQQDDMDDVLASLECFGNQASPDAAVLLKMVEAWLPIAESAAPRAERRRASAGRRVPLVKRQGHRVVDSSGREALYTAGMTKRLSTLWAERRPRVGGGGGGGGKA